MNNNNIISMLYFIIIPTEFVSSKFVNYHPRGIGRAEHGEFPGIVALYVVKNGDFTSCSGTLIDKSHIVTAAHCVINAEPYMVNFNYIINVNYFNAVQLNGPRKIFIIADDLSIYAPSNTRQMRAAILNIVHPQYLDDGKKSRNDIAVLRVRFAATTTHKLGSQKYIITGITTV